MTTRKDLQEWLNRFPEDTIIEFGIQQLEDSDVGDGWEFTDFRSNKFVKPDAEHFGKCYLRIGEPDD
jgi:hypothetical protein